MEHQKNKLFQATLVLFLADWVDYAQAHSSVMRGLVSFVGRTWDKWTQPKGSCWRFNIKSTVWMVDMGIGHL